MPKPIGSLPSTKAKAPKSLPTKASSSGESSTPSPLNRIISLEAFLLEDLDDPNPLLELLSFAKHPDAAVVHKSIWALHRVFIALVNGDKVGLYLGGSAGGRNGEEQGGGGIEMGDEDITAKEVKAWVRERMLEYVEVLGGLLRDNEPALRTSAVPLLFSLLPPLSTTISQENSPTIHIPYFRLILQYILSPTPSLRGAKLSPKGKWQIIEANQIGDLEPGITPSDVISLVTEDFWAKYDDLRWLFFRETSRILQTSSTTEVLKNPENILEQLILLTNLPRVQKDINTFFVPSMAEKPTFTGSSGLGSKKSKNDKNLNINGKSKKGIKGKNGELDNMPDWLAYYENDEGSDDEVSTNGGKRKRTGNLSIHGGIHSIPSQQNQYTTLWEMVWAKIPLNIFWTRKILVAIHGKNGILSYLKSERRVRVADWLGGLVDRGGVEAMLGMNGLFVLMTQYNLDYPKFYPRLYSLLTPQLLHTPYRARFFRLLQTFLSSPLLPSSLIASFIKRLARRALTAPPPGVLIVIPFVYGLMKRHPGVMGMLQRWEDDDGGEYVDPYNDSDPSPITSKAINSSLWELKALQNHYLPSVSTMAKIFSETFTKPEFNLEDFLDHGYATLFETELKRKIKYPPALSISLELDNHTASAAGQDGEVSFPGKEVKEEVRASADIVGQLWSF